MVVKKLNKATLSSKEIIFRQNISIFFLTEIKEKHIKIINGFLYTIYFTNKKYFLKGIKVYVRIFEKKIEISLNDRFNELMQFQIEDIFLINGYFYLTENQADKEKIRKLLRKEKIKELFEL